MVQSLLCRYEELSSVPQCPLQTWVWLCAPVIPSTGVTQTRGFLALAAACCFGELRIIEKPCLKIDKMEGWWYGLTDKSDRYESMVRTLIPGIHEAKRK